MADRELIERLLFLAQTAVDQALDLNYDDPEDYFIYRELRELKAAALAQPEPEELPPGYIDAEHTGRDREMLEIFYRACRSEGGTADEIHLRGLKAVRALAQPEPEGPTDEELLRCYGLAKRDHCYEGPIDDWPKRAERAATVHGLRAVLARWGRPAIEPVPGVEGTDD
jgi:hypothetical protein